MSLYDMNADLRHPVDIVEEVAARRQWDFERSANDEISISIKGGWSAYEASFTWVEELESLHLGCAFDLRVPEHRRSEVLALIAMINEQMWVGHFDLWPAENVVMYRHALLLAGTDAVSARQCDAAMRIAVEACERHYQAFQFVVWAGQCARSALDTINFQTAGEA